MPTESMRPTETAGLLERIDNFIERFVVLPDESAAVAVALWVAHTWAFEAAHGLLDCPLAGETHWQDAPSGDPRAAHSPAVACDVCE